MAFSKQQREKIYLKYSGKCAYCGCDITIKQMQIDHIIPQKDFLHYIKNRVRIPYFLTHLTELDVNNDDNLNPACIVCNKWKSSHDLELFRSELFEQIKRLNDYSSNYRIAKRYGLLEEKLKPIKFHFEQFLTTAL